LVRQRGGDALREHADICDLVEAGGENGKSYPSKAIVSLAGITSRKRASCREQPIP
jgi:hypothetical protein